ncbi:hypothetical protein C4B63_232g1 [Trypanosoma cruzi]|uniref:Uncharacterized protein n=1 Tax=Trypanosoma cruzi TaxID=5693 RepID=A0A2V2UK44_TRYCR|nr:hypothetical protein C4B63_232g1 [Trypanosoma cruzi]
MSASVRRRGSWSFLRSDKAGLRGMSGQWSVANSSSSTRSRAWKRRCESSKRSRARLRNGSGPLEKKHETISEWNRSLESREKELARCQEDFREDLKRLEEDEKYFGVYTSSSNVVSVVSQREVMDDHNMTIEKETQCEEIDVEDEEDHTE